MKTYLKNFFLNAWYALFNEDYRLLKKSLFFDPIYYRKMNPDVLSTGTNPLRHYVTEGFKDKSPSTLFDSHYYRKQLSSLTLQEDNPLIHYLRSGWQEGIKPNCLFDPRSYIKENPKVDFSRTDPLTHYIQKRKDESIPPYFDAIFYRKKYDDVVTSGIHPLEHYLSIGIAERRQTSLLFDVEWYLDRTPVLLKKNMEPFSHYLDYGISEGKSPSPLFDPAYYKSTYKVSESCDLFVHYMTYGVPADHRPCSWFDPEFYRSSYLAAEKNTVIPLVHYLEKGVNEGLYPNRNVNDLAEKPKISIVVPVYNVSPSFLNNCIRSVLYQSYPNWELCLADDCSSNKDIKPLLKRWAIQDKRIKVVFLDENKGISGATNAAASLASGDYFGFLDNDDELAPDCLFMVVNNINTTGADLYYSDEDLIGEDGSQLSVFRKPSFNNNLLLCHNYITHFVVTAMDLFRKVKGFDPAMDGAQDFDLFLKLSEQAKKIIHIPEILYHWRALESSTSINHEQKQYADEAGKNALQAAMDRRKISATVELTEWKFYYRINRRLAHHPTVTVVSCFRHDGLFEEWFTALHKNTSYKNVEYLALPDDEIPPAKEIEGVLRYLPGTANQPLAAKYNVAVQESRGEYIVFLDSRIQILNKDWIEEMLKYCTSPQAGFVTGRILPHGDEEFVSHKPDIRCLSPLYYNRFLQECSRHMNGMQCTQNVFALSWNFSMVSKKRFLDLGGYDTQSFASLFADSDFCLRMGQLGYLHIYTPFALAKSDVPEEKQFKQTWDADQEKSQFQKRWNKELLSGDPYYNHRLSDSVSCKQQEFVNWYAGESREQENL